MRNALFLFSFLFASVATADPPEPGSQPAASMPILAAPPTVAAAPITAELNPPELPLLVRTLLGGRMLRHGAALGALENAVKAGDLATVAEVARNIADEPQLARVAETDTINQAIPPTFFDFQDLLHHRAEALEAAARAADGPAVKAAYDTLGETCGRCHSLWFPVPRD